MIVAASTVAIVAIAVVVIDDKEGVDGSSPSEGLIFIEIPANRQVVLSP